MCIFLFAIECRNTFWNFGKFILNWYMCFYDNKLFFIKDILQGKIYISQFIWKDTLYYLDKYVFGLEADRAPFICLNVHLLHADCSIEYKMVLCPLSVVFHLYSGGQNLYFIIDTLHPRNDPKQRHPLPIVPFEEE